MAKAKNFTVKIPDDPDFPFWPPKRPFSEMDAYCWLQANPKELPNERQLCMKFGWGRSKTATFISKMCNYSVNSYDKVRAAYRTIEHTTDTEQDSEVRLPVDPLTEPSTEQRIITATNPKWLHVKVKQSWLNEVSQELGESVVRAMLDKIDDYCESSGKRYKNYEAAFRNWMRYEAEKKAGGGIG